MVILLVVISKLNSAIELKNKPNLGKKISIKFFIFVERVKNMNIQARKLGLIEEFLRIDDETLLIKLESFIKQEKKISHERSLKPMILDEFHEMINQAKHDSDAGRVISHQDLKKKAQKWNSIGV